MVEQARERAAYGWGLVSVAGEAGSQERAPSSFNLSLSPFFFFAKDINDLNGIQMWIISHKSMSKRLIENRQFF